jgi:hypothetical protein
VTTNPASVNCLTLRQTRWIQFNLGPISLTRTKLWVLNSFPSSFQSWIFIDRSRSHRQREPTNRNRRESDLAA